MAIGRDEPARSRCEAEFGRVRQRVVALVSLKANDKVALPDDKVALPDDKLALPRFAHSDTQSLHGLDACCSSIPGV